MSRRYRCTCSHAKFRNYAVSLPRPREYGVPVGLTREPGPCDCYVCRRQPTGVDDVDGSSWVGHWKDDNRVKVLPFVNPDDAVHQRYHASILGKDMREVSYWESERQKEKWGRREKQMGLVGRSPGSSAAKIRQ